VTLPKALSRQDPRKTCDYRRYGCWSLAGSAGPADEECHILPGRVASLSSNAMFRLPTLCSDKQVRGRPPAVVDLPASSSVDGPAEREPAA
jgi:hypothetical protein